MKERNYSLTVAGNGDGKTELLGSVVSNAANLTSMFITREGMITFYFRSRGDARLVLGRVKKALSCEQNTPDGITYQGCSAVVAKTK